MEPQQAILIVMAVLFLSGLLYLATRRWFWIIALWLLSVAAAFSCIASIIHFQILWAVGYFVLSIILSGLARAVSYG